MDAMLKVLYLHGAPFYEFDIAELATAL